MTENQRGTPAQALRSRHPLIQEKQDSAVLRNPESASSSRLYDLFDSPEHTLPTASTAISLTISTPHGPVHGLWRPSNRNHAAVLLLPGRDGSLSGPAGLFTQLAPPLQRFAAVAQLSYSQPDSLADCGACVLDALDALSRQGVERVALIGWDLGGTVAILAGAKSPLVTGVACLAPDTRAGDVDDLAAATVAISPHRLLLAHGSADTVIPQSSSILLHSQAGHSSELALYPHETHDFIRYRAVILQRLILWAATLLRTPFRPGRDASACTRSALTANR